MYTKEKTELNIVSVTSSDLVLLPPSENQEFTYWGQVGIAITDIKESGLLHPRSKVNLEHVKALVEALEEKQDLDPLVVFWDKEKDCNWLVDGYHRLYAYREVGITDVVCDIYDGNLKTATLWAAQANSQNKATLARSRKDKRKAVMQLLLDDEYQLLSDRQIAEKAKVSHSFVSNCRNELLKKTKIQTISLTPIFQEQAINSPIFTIEEDREEPIEPPKKLSKIERKADETYEKDRLKALEDIFISFKSNLRDFPQSFIDAIRKEIDMLFPHPEIQTLLIELEILQDENKYLQSEINKINQDVLSKI